DFVIRSLLLYGEYLYARSQLVDALGHIARLCDLVKTGLDLFGMASDSFVGFEVFLGEFFRGHVVTSFMLCVHLGVYVGHPSCYVSSLDTQPAVPGCRYMGVALAF